MSYSKKRLLTETGDFHISILDICAKDVYVLEYCSSTVSLNVLELYNYYKISAIHIKKTYFIVTRYKKRKKINNRFIILFLVELLEILLE